MLARTSCRLMGEQLFRLYGLNFDSDIAMHAALPGTGIADVTVRLASERPIESNEPPGELMAFTDGGGRRLSTITQTIDAYILRVHGMSDFVISTSLDELTCYPAPDTNPDFLSTLMCGGVASLLLTLRGFCVLHASAVEHRGRGFGLVGHSGWGKSTTAARLCIAGARLITDDVLAIAPTTALISGPCRELRLRAQAQTLAKLVPVVEEPRLTADERIAIRPVLALHEETPLHSLIEIGLYKDIDGLRVERVPPSRAIFSLIGAIRTGGGVASRLMEAQFESLVDIANKVPVYRAHIPWDPDPMNVTVNGLLEVVGAGSSALSEFA
jgi:hypothetical protein